MKDYVVLILFLIIISEIANGSNVNDLSNSTNNPYKWIEDKVNSIFSEAERLTKLILIKVFDFLLLIARLIYMSLALAGALMWFSGLSPYKGRRMIIGAAIIALIVEFINTFVTS